MQPFTFLRLKDMKVHAKYFIVISKYTRPGRPINSQLTFLTKINKLQITIHSTCLYAKDVGKKSRTGQNPSKFTIFFTIPLCTYFRNKHSLFNCQTAYCFP